MKKAGATRRRREWKQRDKKKTDNAEVNRARHTERRDA